VGMELEVKEGRPADRSGVRVVLRRGSFECTGVRGSWAKLARCRAFC
jgi:hypothetical protein